MIIVALLLLFGGNYATFSLKVESVPDVNYPFVQVNTYYPGTPQDVLEHVSKPIEQSVSGMEGVDTVISTSDENISVVGLRLTGGANLEETRKISKIFWITCSFLVKRENRP